MWPIIVWIVLNCVGLGVAMAQHGTDKTGKHNAFLQLIATIITNAVLY